MNLLTPGLGLLVWTSFIIVSLLIGLFLVFKIWNKKDIDQTTKLLWTLLIIFAPFLGIILFLIFGRNQGSEITKKQ